MSPIKHILFPFDFSDRCCAAVPFVQAMASHFSARLTLISVAQPFLYTGVSDPGPPVYIAPDEVTDELQARLDCALQTEFAHLKVERAVTLGDPAGAIIDFVRENHVDLIMMPTHGAGRFRRLLLGSVAAKVLHDAECPVWTAAHLEEPGARQHLPLRRILCAVDGTHKDAALLQWAGQFAKDVAATLALVHVIPGMAGFPSAQMDREYVEDVRQKAREEITHMQVTTGVEASLAVTIGSVEDGVRVEALRQGADLIVIGRGILHETLGRLRTHAYGIIRRSPCPVLSV